MSVFTIHHITRYEYNRPVKESNNEIKIYPYRFPGQEVLNHELIITHSPSVQTFHDYWGNKVGVFSLLQPHMMLSIESKLIVRTLGASEVTINRNGTFGELQHEMDENLQLLELATPDFITNENAIDNIIQQIHFLDNTVAQTVENCAAYIFEHFKYVKGITNTLTTVNEILEIGAGVCQDFAHVMLQVLRTLNIPGRYVSGYICPNKNGMRGEGATHAWVEAYLPYQGWAGIDPTNNVWVTNRHVKLAVGRHFKDCSPVKGTFKGIAKQKLSVYVSVSYEDGQTYEDLNNVPLSKQAADDAEDAMLEGFAAQQQ